MRFKFLFHILLLIAFIFSCNQTKENNISKIPEKEINTTFFDDEIKKRKLQTIEEIEKSIMETLNDTISEFTYKTNYFKSLFKSSHWNKINKDLHDDIYINFSQLLSANNKINEAIYYQELALEHCKSQLQKDPKNYFLCYNELAVNYSNVYKYDIVMDYTQKALKIAEKYPSKVSTKDYLISLNNMLFYLQGNQFLTFFEIFKEKKENYFDKISTIKLQDKDYLDIIFKKFEIKYLLHANNLEKAILKLDEFEKFSPITKEFESEKISYYLSIFDDTINFYQFNLKDFTKALELSENFYNKCLYYSDFKHYTMLALSKLAALNYDLNNPSKSNFYLNKINAALQPNLKSTSFYSLKILKARNLSKLNQHLESIKILDDVLPLMSEHLMNKKCTIESLQDQNYKNFNSDAAINIFATASNLYMEHYKKNKIESSLLKGESLALAASAMTIELIDNSIFDSNLSNRIDKISETLLFLTATKYKNNIKNKKKLINIIEKISSNQLFSQFKKQVIENNSKLNALSLKINKLEQRKNYYEEQLLFSFNIEIKKKKNKIENEIITQKKQLKKELKGFENIKDDFSIDKIQNEISTDENILKYYVSNSNVYRLQIDKNELIIDSIGALNDIEKLVINYINVLKNPSKNYKEQSQLLFDIFLDIPLKKNVQIVPQNFINYLPFETLMDTKKQLVLEKSNFIYNFSLPLLYASKIYKLNNSNNKTLCFAADYTKSNTGLKPLLYAQKEVENIAKITDGKTINHATKENFIENATHFKIYHLAMHAKLDDANFEKSNLIFSNDVPLYFKDFYHLNLPLDLVVLSACNTGTGKIINGESIMSLSRALTFSGVRSSVVSYWEVPDKETAELMELFYKNLKIGLSKSEALSQAKKDFISKYPLKNHPFFWAGFVLNGNNDAPFSTNYWLYITSFFVLFTLVLLWYKRKKLFYFFQ